MPTLIEDLTQEIGIKKITFYNHVFLRLKIDLREEDEKLLKDRANERESQVKMFSNRVEISIVSLSHYFTERASCTIWHYITRFAPHSEQNAFLSYHTAPRNNFPDH